MKGDGQSVPGQVTLTIKMLGSRSKSFSILRASSSDTRRTLTLPFLTTAVAVLRVLFAELLADRDLAARIEARATAD